MVYVCKCVGWGGWDVLRVCVAREDRLLHPILLEMNCDPMEGLHKRWFARQKRVYSPRFLQHQINIAKKAQRQSQSPTQTDLEQHRHHYIRSGSNYSECSSLLPYFSVASGMSSSRRTEMLVCEDSMDKEL